VSPHHGNRTGNFNYPYISQSIREFWRRWHISLSTWFKNYLYIPLGGNRKGQYRTYLNLIIVFFITGLWHGANYNFIIWGLIHGLFLLAERIKPSFFSGIPKIFYHLYTLLVVTLAWVFFRTETLDNSMAYFGRLFAFSETGDFYPLIYLNNYLIVLIISGIILAIPIRKYIKQKFRTIKIWIPSGMSNIITYFVYLGLFMYCILELSIATHIPFIYFKF